MAEEFIFDLPDFLDPSSGSSQPDREAVKVLLLGSQRGIAHLIHWFHQHRFSEAGDWSRPQPLPNSDRHEMISITIKYIRLN